MPAASLPGPDRTGANRIAIGIDEDSLSPVVLDFDNDPHFLVFGDAQCGKTNLLRLIARWIVEHRTPAQAKLVIVDYRRSLLGAVEGDHLLDYIPGAQQAENMATGILEAMTARLPGPNVTTEQLRNRSWWHGSEVYLLVDDYDLVAASGGNPLGALVDLLPQARDIGLHLILARQSGGASRAMYDQAVQRMKEMASPALIMSGNREEGQLFGNVRPQPLPVGRGFYADRRFGARLIQTAYLESA